MIYGKKEGIDIGKEDDSVDVILVGISSSSAFIYFWVSIFFERKRV